MRLSFRTRAEKRRAYRRVAGRFYGAMFALTVLFGAVALLLRLLGRL